MYPKQVPETFAHTHQIWLVAAHVKRCSIFNVDALHLHARRTSEVVFVHSFCGKVFFFCGSFPLFAIKTKEYPDIENEGINSNY